MRPSGRFQKGRGPGRRRAHPRRLGRDRPGREPPLPRLRRRRKAPLRRDRQMSYATQRPAPAPDRTGGAGGHRRPRRSGPVAPWSPVAFDLLVANQRDEAARYEPLETSENAEGLRPGQEDRLEGQALHRHPCPRHAGLRRRNPPVARRRLPRPPGGPALAPGQGALPAGLRRPRAPQQDTPSPRRSR